MSEVHLSAFGRKIQKNLEASIYPPPCECADCQNGFYLIQEQCSPQFSYRGKLSDHDAQRIAAAHVQDTQQDRAYLLQRLASHADIFLNRWKKKSGEKRQTLLVSSIPELYEHRWLLPRYSNTPESKRWDSRTRDRRCQLLLPWLSLEVLKTNPAVLFALLHYRTVYPPQDWAPYDSRQLTVSWACGHFDVEYSRKNVVMYGPRYGELVDWQAGPAHRADILGFPRALLVLEAQAYLMGILRKIVDKTLESADLSKPATSEKWKSVINLGFKQSGMVEFWSPYTNQAYSAPPVFDIDKLLSIVQTRLDAASDHLWFLQTEPAYMRRYIRILFQRELFKHASPDEAAWLLVQELFQDLGACWWWRWIKVEASYVKDRRHHVRDNIHPGKRLPPSYDRAIGALELLLVNRVINCASHLSVMVPPRPGFRHLWSFKRLPNADGTAALDIQRKGTMDTKELFHKDPLEWCLLQLQGAPDKQSNFDHAMLFAILEWHLANSATKERARLDDVLYGTLSDLAAFHEMLVSVRLSRPQNEARDIDQVLKSDDREAWKASSSSISLSGKDSVALGTAILENFYKAPLPSGQKNSSWLLRSRTIRNALEAFWRGLRERSQTIFENSRFSREEARDILKVISADLSSKYINAIKAEEGQVLASIERASSATTSLIQKEWGSSETTHAPGPISKPKVKTRPVEQPGALEEAEDRIADLKVDALEESSPIILVPQRAFHVLTRMFPVTAEEANKSVQWDNFVHAMSDMGFSARNGGGSAIVFKNEVSASDGHAGGKIVFHKPHPVATIDPVMLHSMGKRMAKWFGWHRERFVLDS